MSDYTPSKYQEAIYDFVSNGRGNGFVDAVAGSGKTFTLVECAKLIAGRGIFCAFNKHIKEELARKLEDTTMSVATIHSMGLRTIRDHEGYGEVKTDTKKYWTIARELVDGTIREGRLAREQIDRAEKQALRDEWPVSDLNKMCNLIRLNLLDSRDPEDIDFIAGHHGMDFHPAIYPLLQTFMQEMLRMGYEAARYSIDFTDMLWLPAAANMEPQKYPWVFVDEAQDLNRAQLNIVKKSVAPGGRVLFVGDPKQAIYGFAGADASSTTKIIESMDCEILPLSVCYRCPVSHIELAKKLVPQIEPAPGAKDGTVTKMQRAGLIEEAHEGDLILCRTTAPLLEVCYKLISSKISASVRGRDIGKGLVKVVDDVEKRSPDFDNFSDALHEYERDESAKLLRRSGDNEAQIAALQDRIECVSVVYSISEAHSFGKLIGVIESLFATGKPSVMLSTVHRAKGLENDRIFILRPDLMPHPMAKHDWEQEQEQNLIYVAYTRAKRDLVFVNES